MKLATLCYVKRDGQTLMLHRIKKENDMHAGKWNGLGGKLEPGETPEECVVREVAEESGLRLRDPHLRGMITFPAFAGDDDWYTFVYTATRFEGELIESPEGVLAWVPDADLLALALWPGDRIFLPWLQQDAFFSAKFVYKEDDLVRYNVVFYHEDGRVQAEQEHFAEAERDAASGQPPAFPPLYRPEDDTYCWLCNGPVIKHHCKIVCQVCGFMRDCSDP